MVRPEAGKVVPGQSSLSSLNSANNAQMNVIVASKLPGSKSTNPNVKTEKSSAKGKHICIWCDHPRDGSRRRASSTSTLCSPTSVVGTASTSGHEGNAMARDDTLMENEVYVTDTKRRPCNVDEQLGDSNVPDTNDQVISDKYNDPLETKNNPVEEMNDPLNTTSESARKTNSSPRGTDNDLADTSNDPSEEKNDSQYTDNGAVEIDSDPLSRKNDPLGSGGKAYMNGDPHDTNSDRHDTKGKTPHQTTDHHATKAKSLRIIIESPTVDNINVSKTERQEIKGGLSESREKLNSLPVQNGLELSAEQQQHQCTEEEEEKKEKDVEATTRMDAELNGTANIAQVENDEVTEVEMNRCREQFREEIQKLNAALTNFRQHCKAEMTEYEATVKKDCEELTENIKDLERKKAEEMQKYNDIVRLRKLEEENALKRQKEHLLIQDEEIMNKEDDLSRRQNDLAEYEREIDEIEAYLKRRHDLAQRKADDLKLLDEEIKNASEELQAEKTRLNLTNGGRTSHQQVARLNWEFLQKTLVDKKELLESALRRTKNQLTAAQHTLEERDGEIIQLRNRVADLEAAATKKDERINELGKRLAQAIRTDLTEVNRIETGSRRLSTPSMSKLQYMPRIATASKTSSGGRTSLLRTSAMYTSPYQKH